MSAFNLDNYGVNLNIDIDYVTCEHQGCPVWLIEEFTDGCRLSKIAAIAQHHHATHHREPHLNGDNE